MQNQSITAPIIVNIRQIMYNNGASGKTTKEREASGSVPTDGTGQVNFELPHEEIFYETLAMLSSQPKRKYSQQEINEARGNLALMNDRVFLMTFIDNKNNHPVKGIADAARKIHGLAPIPAIELIELGKLNDFTKAELSVEYHDLFDICCVFKAKISEHEEVIRMQEVANPTALELSKEAKKVTEPSEFVNTNLDRRHEALQLSQWIMRECVDSAVILRHFFLCLKL